MTRNWTKVGTESGFEHGTIERAIQQLDWHPIAGGYRTGACQGLGMRAAIKELKLPRVSHVAETNQLAPYGFYGIRAHYMNGDADVYLVDRGSDIVVVCSDFYPKAEVA